MRKLSRVFFIESFALYLATIVADGMVFERGFETFVMAGLVITAASLFVKPVINLLLLPLNLITFNLFKWVSAAVALYLVTLVVTGFKISAFVLNPEKLGFMGLFPITLEGALAIVGFSFLISLFTSVIGWIFSS